MKISYPASLLAILFFTALSFKSQAQIKRVKPDTSLLVPSMIQATKDWNNGDLDKYMSLYDSKATMMMPYGNAPLDSIRALYVKYYFANGKPKQNLAYDDFNIRMLGNRHALLTGRFTLSGNGKATRTGRFSLVMVYTDKGWRIMHDHSG